VPALTLKDLLGVLDITSGARRPSRIRLMRHAFRGHKAQLKKVAKWTNVSLTEEQAYPESHASLIGRPTAADVLNAVRLDRRLARLVSADQDDDGTIQKGDLLLVFGATGGKSAEFLAAFEVMGKTSWSSFRADYEDILVPAPDTAREAGLSGLWLGRGLGYNSLPRQDRQMFELRDRPDILGGYERRLVIEWKSPVSWLQKDLEKEVLEIRPKGFVREFTSLLDFTLTFRELQAIVGTGNESGDPVWRQRLAGSCGVYIIQSHEGPQYVGAAFGRKDGGGFLGRWSTYTQTRQVSAGTDDKKGLRRNTGLKKFLDQGDPTEQRQRLDGLTFSIAHVMDRTAPKKEVLAMETRFKMKLGTRAVALGLNDN